jgi:hypothetical protein
VQTTEIRNNETRCADDKDVTVPSQAKILGGIGSNLLLLSPLISLTALIPSLTILLAILVDEVQLQPLSGKDLQPEIQRLVTVPRSRFVNMPDIRKQYVSVSAFSCCRIQRRFRHVDLMFFGISRNDVCEGS